MSEEMPSNPSAATRFLIVIAVFLVLAGAVAYSFHERSVAKQLGAQNSEMSSALNATRDQISALTTKLNAMNTEQTPGRIIAVPPGHLSQARDRRESAPANRRLALEENAVTVG